MTEETKTIYVKEKDTYYRVTIETEDEIYTMCQDVTWRHAEETLETIRTAIEHKQNIQIVKENMVTLVPTNRIKYAKIEKRCGQ